MGKSIFQWAQVGLALTLICLVFPLLLISCSRGPYQKAATVMDTVAQLSALDGEAEPAVTESMALLEKLDTELGPNEGGDSQRLAEAAGNGNWLPVSPDTYAVLALAREWGERTGGAFDVTTGPLVTLWGIGTDKERVPSAEEIATARALVGWERLELAPDGQAARLLAPGMGIDLGGLAKGYALDEIKAIYQAHGVTNGLINLGGSSLYALGHNQKGQPWRIGIRHPRDNDPQKYFGVVSLSDAALASSGDYERFFEQDGTRYHHILDPHTGYPARAGLIAVTVVAKGEQAGILSDLLSTALFVLGEEQGKKLIENAPFPVTALFVSKNGTGADAPYHLSEAHSSGMPPFHEIISDVSSEFAWE